MLVPMRTLLDHAMENGYGILAANVNLDLQAAAAMEAAHRLGSPIILQLSRGALAFARMRMVAHEMMAAAEEWPDVPFAAHLDHGNEFATCESAIGVGLTSVMIDGTLMHDGKTPSGKDLVYNIDVTRKVVALAHARGVTVEGEVGCLGHLMTGKGEEEDGHGAKCKLSRDELLTDPKDAARFVAATGVDALAVAIGTSHGAYKFTEPPTGEVLKIDRVAEIHAAIPNTPLVMHGASSVPQELLEIIRRFGGELKPTWGVPLEEIQRAIKNGVRKVNVDTDSRLAITGAIRKFFAEKRAEFDPRGYLKPAREAMMDVCIKRIQAFGSEGQASKIKAATLDDLAKFYATL